MQSSIHCLKNTFSRYFLYFLMTYFISSSFSLKASEKLNVAVGLTKPPYVIQRNNSGFELELIKSIFHRMGKNAKFVYTEFGHSAKMLDVKEIDAVMTTNKQVFTDESKLSDVYITYQNVAISLKANQFNINSISELSNYTMASFQKADKVLGKEFYDAAFKSPLYIKIADQRQQPTLLLKKRVEVLVMDKNIFKYIANEVGITGIDSKFVFHPVFPKTHYRMAFKNRENAKHFNQELAKYTGSKEYKKLKERYNLWVAI